MTIPQSLINAINTENTTKNIISKDTVIHKTPCIDFEGKKVALVNGNPKLISQIDAVKQWIMLFITTPKGAYSIYDGTGFGTSVRKLFGRKQIGYGYEEAEIEREIKEGFTLCPAISQVSNVAFEKNGRYLNITVEVELKDGSLVTETVEDVLKVRI